MYGELKQVADLALFAKIVQTGGISKCAADLGMERTTISRRLGSLERQLGVKLLDRTPKYIAVTDAGRRCLEQCEMLLESAQNAEAGDGGFRRRRYLAHHHRRAGRHHRALP
jgi:DNA-binding transcriptional LysR family regulator